MKSIFAIICIIIIFSGCYYDNVEEIHPEIAPCDTTKGVSFAKDIFPIMTNSCSNQNSACHNTDQSTSGYGLESYDAIITTINSTGTFLLSITHDPSIPNHWMPQNLSAKIDACSIEKIECWLNNGMQNN